MNDTSLIDNRIITHTGINSIIIDGSINDRIVVNILFSNGMHNNSLVIGSILWKLGISVVGCSCTLLLFC